ncbi:MAG: proline--tRNA ligase [Candidatus Margulisbacteria bacterium GWF2_35_9]|nr:MAG: proline--tRNA ligase [Candidatus Margulisbacteria bacterium GWF2_35_9]
MKYSKYFIPTLRDIPSEAEIPSHKYALKGGYIKKIASGIYDYLPLGLKVLRKIEAIVRKEMNKSGAMEVSMPSMVPAELWQKSGRWSFYGKELLRIKDRADREFCFGPTHEEVIVDMVSNNIQSYKQLPINLYQIQTKFRDEIRPRFGLMRAREFTMKDAYSFHEDQSSLDATYQDMYKAYCNIFTNCGLKFRVVNADSGNIGGNSSQEFMITADSGEDEILYCSSCTYAANVEKAATIIHNPDEENQTAIEVETPGIKSIEDVSKFLNSTPTQLIKALVYQYEIMIEQNKYEAKYALIFIRGDYDLSEIKLGNKLNALSLRLATDDEIQTQLNAPSGFLGPVGLATNKSLTILADDSIKGLKNAIVGANKVDYHLKNVNTPKDYTFDEYIDLKIVKEGDTCPECKKGQLIKERGIEVGHIFKLGSKYSESMKAVFLDKNGKEQPFIMGCYGIGIGRTAMAAIEQNYDDNGPTWPIQIAPFEVILIQANMNNETQSTVANNLYQTLLSNNIDVLFDDRNERMGVKFNDADLIGSPIRIVIGKKADEGIVELNLRSGIKDELAVADVVTTIDKHITELLQISNSKVK